MNTHYLKHLFSPSSIALFGASDRPESVGARVYDNLISGEFPGSIFPINPRHNKIRGKRCYPSLTAVSSQVELAVIATPKSTITEIIHDCGEHGVRAVIILSAGFTDDKDNGPELLRIILEEARRYRMRILGPNCLGLIRPASNLNTTFSKNTARRGGLALISQSGALCTAILDWAASYDIGFSAIVSLGDAMDISFGDLLDYLALDPETKSILLYIEGIRDVRRFMSGLRSAARLKPVVVLKVGRHTESAKAALTHTGSLVGADDVFEAALRRAGVVRTNTVEQLFAAAQLLATTKNVCGNRLAIITNGGGPGIMATDCAMDRGIRMAKLDDKTIDRLSAILPPVWSAGNPVDILGDARPERYSEALSICLDDANIDGILVILTPQAMTQPLEAARALIDIIRQQHKPVLTCWMGSQNVMAARELFIQHHIPTFPTPENAVEAFDYLVDYYHNQQLLMQVPGPLEKSSEPDINGARLILDGVLGEKRTVLNDAECRALMSAFDIPVMLAHEAHSANEALVAAESLGFPIAMKINSPDIIHKSEVNGVRLYINNAEAVRGAFSDLMASVQQQRPDAMINGVTIERMYTNPNGRELLVGVMRDSVFGPVITFGAGGIFVEVMRDRAVALPPLNGIIIDDLINRTRISQLLGAYRGMPAVKIESLKYLLRRLSEMVCELPRIREIDINPVVIDEKGVLALDTRIVIETRQPTNEPYAHMAIHPYPTHLVTHWQLSDGTDITIRPIRPEDADIEFAFVHNLSTQSKYFRFMQALQELTPQMLIRFTQIDYDREMALIATTETDGKDREIGVARYVANPDGESCEFAIVVADDWHQRGIGTHLLENLVRIATTKGYKFMEGEVMTNNKSMLDLAIAFDFRITVNKEDTNIQHIIKML